MLASMVINGDKFRRQQTRLPRYWVGRLILLLEVLVSLLAVCWFEDRSLAAQAIRVNGEAGSLLVLIAAAGCFVGIADVIVNDLMPARYEMPTAKEWRHYGFGGIGLSLTAIGMVVVYTHGFSVLALSYWLNAGFAGALMFFDVFARLQQGSA